MSINTNTKNNKHDHKTEECHNLIEFAATQVYHLMIEATGGKGTTANDRADDFDYAIDVIWHNAPLTTPLAAGYEDAGEIANHIASQWKIDEIRCDEVIHTDHTIYVHGAVYVDRVVPASRASLGDHNHGMINITWSISPSGAVSASADLTHVKNMSDADIVSFHERVCDFWQTRWVRHTSTR